MSANAAVNATVLRPDDFNGEVYALVADERAVILPMARVLATSPTQYVVALQTAPNLMPGQYRGQFSIKLCRDAACAREYPGSPLSLPYSLTVTPSTRYALTAVPDTTLEVSAQLGGAAPRQVRVAVESGPFGWTAGATQGWVKLGNSSGTGSGSFTVDFDPGSLPEGSYQQVITVSTADRRRIDLPVKLTVLAARFEITGEGWGFNVVNGASAPPQEIAFSLDNSMTGPWALSSNREWLKVTPQSGTLPGKATLTVDTVNSKLSSGTHFADLTLTSPLGRTSGRRVQMNLFKPILGSSLQTVGFGGTTGRDFGSKSLTLSLNTGRQAWPWTLVNLPAWVKASPTSGTTGDTGTPVTLTPDPSLAPMGSTTSLLTAQAIVNGETITTSIPLTINRDQQKILPSTTGIALVATPGWSRLTRSITVSDNYGLGAGWSASSDQRWLSVVRTGDKLTVQADPTSLPLDTTSYATVTLTPADAGASAPDKIVVGLWKGSATPAATTILPHRYSSIVADPVRPLVYVHDAGGTIDVFNVYTRQKTASIAAGSSLRDMAISADGKHLYVPDYESSTMIVVDLLTLAPSASWPLPTTGMSPYSQPIVIRPNGVEIVLADSGAYRARDGKQLSEHAFGSSKAASQDGRTVHTIDEGTSSASVKAFAVDYAETGGGALSVAQRAWILAGSNGHDIAMNADGSRTYTASGSPYRCNMYGPNLAFLDQAPEYAAYPNNTDVDSQGRFYCGIGNNSRDADVWMYDANGNFLRKFEFTTSGLLVHGMAVSGDAMMLVGLTEQATMAIVPVGP